LECALSYMERRWENYGVAKRYIRLF
jgi:hypothetical protein